MKNKISSQRKIVFNVVLSILLFILPFTVLEITIRILYSDIDLWEETGRTDRYIQNTQMNWLRDWAFLDAFCAFRARPGKYADGKTVNEHGFISTPELTIAKPENVFRIVFLGGSSTAGTGYNLPDEKTWPWQVIEILRETIGHKKIEFINGALSGYSSFESYGRLWSRIRFFSPDVIVVYHGWNEMYYFNMVDHMPTWRTLSDGSWSFDHIATRTVTYEPLGIDHFIRYSQVLTRFRLLLSRRVLSGELGPSEDSTDLRTHYDQRALEIWRTNLQLIRSTAELCNAELFVAKQATLIVPDLPQEEKERCYYHYHGFDHDAHVRAFQDIYRIIEEEIDPERIIDTTLIYGIPEYFRDHVHPMPKGARAIAEIVARSLLPYLQATSEYTQNKQSFIITSVPIGNT